MNDKKQKLKDASMELKHAKANKAMLEKKLVRLLKEYVVPTTSKYS